MPVIKRVKRVKPRVLPKGAGAVICDVCGATARADGKGSPIVLPCDCHKQPLKKPKKVAKRAVKATAPRKRSLSDPATMDPNDPEGLAASLTELKSLKDEAKQLGSAINDKQAECIDWMKAAGIVAMPGYGTLVEGESLVLDEDKLRAELPAPVWRQITRRVVDKPLLEAMVRRGVVDPKIVMACSSTKPIAPYIRLASK